MAHDLPVTHIGLVPTMGNLHEGHLQLVKAAVADLSVHRSKHFRQSASVRKNEDLNNYPRSLESDTGLLAEAGCDLLFAPDNAEMYGIAGSMKTNILGFRSHSEPLRQNKAGAF